MGTHLSLRWAERDIDIIVASKLSLGGHVLKSPGAKLSLGSGDFEIVGAKLSLGGHVLKSPGPS